MLTTEGYDIVGGSQRPGRCVGRRRRAAAMMKATRSPRPICAAARRSATPFASTASPATSTRTPNSTGRPSASPSPASPTTTPARPIRRSCWSAASATLCLLDGKWETIGSGSHVDEERRSERLQLLRPDLPTVRLSPSGADATRTKFALQSTIEFGAPAFRQLSHRLCRNQGRNLQECLSRLLHRPAAAETVARPCRHRRAIPR